MERAVYDRIRALEQDHWWFAGRRAVLSRALEDLGLPASARILEVGCGAGGNIQLLTPLGEVSALEPDDESRAYVAERYKMKVEGGLLPGGLPYPPESFDLVCAFDVIEHVDDDAGSVAALARLVKPGGAMLTTVPAYQWMWSRHDEAHHHKRRYALPAYRALFERAGLKVERASHFNTLLLPLAVVQRFAKKLLGIESADDAMPPAWLNGLLTRVFASERALLPLSPPVGLSILLAARKPA
jgi:SAM-dependent methyltransferase